MRPVWARAAQQACGMMVGVLQFELLIHGAASLKDKRRVIRSVRDTLAREHRVGVAEVGSLESWNRAELAIASVSSDTRKLAAAFDAITRRVRERTDCELGQTSRSLMKVDQMQGLDESGEGDSEAMEAVTAELLAIADAGEFEVDASVPDAGRPETGGRTATDRGPSR